LTLIDKDLVAWFENLRNGDIFVIGGKNANLGEMIHPDFAETACSNKPPIQEAKNAERKRNLDKEKEIAKKITDRIVEKQKSGTLKNGDIKSAFNILRVYLNCAETTEILSAYKQIIAEFLIDLIESEQFAKQLEAEFSPTMKDVNEKREKLLKQRKDQATTKIKRKLNVSTNEIGIEKFQSYGKEKKPNANDDSD
jgi:phosphoenolpyruvate synthase/pyruvate phosphate dikinase